MTATADPVPMLPLVYARRWRLAGGLFLITVLLGTLMPAWWLWDSLPRGLFFAADKWVHGLTFLFLALWFSGQYPPRAYWRIAAGLFAFGIITELCQGLVSYRLADVADLVADTVGVTVGLLIASLGAGGWSLRFEAWLATRNRD